jgi:ABC-2 type transport system permease protein
VVMTLAFPIMLYLFVGRSAGGSNIKLYGVTIAEYYMIAMAMFGAFSGAMTGNAIRISQERKEGWIRQLRLTPLPANGYVVAKLLASMALTIPAVVIVLLLGRFYGGVHLAAWEWIVIAIVIWLGAMIFTALAVAIGYRIQPDQVQPTAMLFYFLFMILGGILFPLPQALQDVGKFTPTYQTINIAIDVMKGSSVDAWLPIGLVIWLVIFGSLAWASVRASAETV